MLRKCFKWIIFIFQKCLIGQRILAKIVHCQLVRKFAYEVRHFEEDCIAKHKPLCKETLVQTEIYFLWVVISHINSKIYYKSLTILCYICVIYKIAIFLKNRDPSESCYNGRTFDPTVTKLFLNLFWERKFEIYANQTFFKIQTVSLLWRQKLN